MKRRLLGTPAATWRQHLMLTMGRERALGARMLNEFRRVAVQASGAVLNGHDAESGLTAHDTQVMKILLATYTESMPVYAKPVLDAGGKAARPKSFEALVTNWIRTTGARRAMQITRTTREQLRNVMARGREQGMGARGIAKLIREDFGDGISRARSEMIARTETNSAANAAQYMAADSLGISMQREWIAAEDERTRDDHVAADGQVVGMEEPFIIGGEELMYPGDPSGSPEQIINCRCATGFIVTE